MKSRHETVKFFALALAFLLILGMFNGVLSLLSLFTPFFSSNKLDYYKVYGIESEIHHLDIEIHSANFEIEASPEGQFWVESNYKHLKLREKGDKLIIEDQKNFHPNAFSGAEIKLYIPEDYFFDVVCIRTGAGANHLENVQAKKMDIQFGVGQSHLQKISASEEARLEAGAGQLSIRDSSFNNLDLKLGVGEFDFSGQVLGRSKMEMGVGSSQIELEGRLEDYRLDIQKGLGRVHVGQEEFEDRAQIGQGESEISIEGGVGAINIDFSGQ